VRVCVCVRDACGIHGHVQHEGYCLSCVSVQVTVSVVTLATRFGLYPLYVCVCAHVAW